MKVKNLIKKLLRPGIVAVLLVVGAASGWAAYNDFTTNNPITINISDLSINLTMLSSGNVQQLKVNAGNIEVQMAASSVLQLTSTDRRKLTVSGQSSHIEEIVYGCESALSSVKITFNATDATQTLTITPSSDVCSGTSGGSGTTGSGGGGGGGAAGVAATPAAAEAPVAAPAAPAAAPTTALADAAQLTQILGVTRDTAKESQSAGKVATSASELKVSLNESDKTIAANFVTYGTTEATRRLGSGERLALVRDQMETLGKVSSAALEQLANGQKPTDRNLPKEQAQLPKVLKAFESLLGRRPNFTNPNEDLAWNTLVYRVRFTRDLNKERAGIAKFKAVNSRNPKSPLDWAVVRAWGYALKK